MFHHFIRKLKHFTQNPYLNIIIGILILYTGISEAVNQLIELEHFTIGAHHGVILIAILHILKTIPDLFSGIEYIEKAEINKD